MNPYDLAKYLLIIGFTIFILKTIWDKTETAKKEGNFKAGVRAQKYKQDLLAPKSKGPKQLQDYNKKKRERKVIEPEVVDAEFEEE